MAQRAGTQRNWRGKRLKQSVPSGILQTHFFLICLFIQQISIETQCAPGTNLDPEDPWGTSSPSLSSESRSTQHPPSGWPSRVHAYSPLLPRHSYPSPRPLCPSPHDPLRSLLAHCLPPLGRCVLSKDRTCVLFIIVSQCPAQDLAYSRCPISACRVSWGGQPP